MPLIAVMDDDTGTRWLVTQVLIKDGYEVMAAGNGAEGLALILKHKPDLVVSDVQMPEMSGFEVLERMRADADVHSIGWHSACLMCCPTSSSLTCTCQRWTALALLKPFGPVGLMRVWCC